jgi:hypothetical protein
MAATPEFLQRFALLASMQRQKADRLTQVCRRKPGYSSSL